MNYNNGLIKLIYSAADLYEIYTIQRDMQCGSQRRNLASYDNASSP